MFASIEKALAFIKEAIQKFPVTGATLRTRIIEIDSLLQRAKQNNDQASMGKLIVAKSQTKALLDEYHGFLDRLGPFRNWFVDASPQMGLLPVWIIAGAGVLATSLYLFFEIIKNEGKALDLIKQGMLTPSQATSILSGGGIAETLSSAKNLVLVAVVGYALFMFGPMLKKGFN